MRIGLPSATSAACCDESRELGRVLDDLHRAAAEHVARAHEHRIAERSAARIASSTCSTVAPGGCGMPRPLRKLSKRRRSSARSMASDDDPMMGAASGAAASEVDRGLAAELHDRGRRFTAALSAVAGLVLDDVAHRLFVERLEVEAIARVEVGGNRLRVLVRHDRLIAGVLERPCRVHGAVVELDALADADRPAADDERLLARLRRWLRSPARTSSRSTASRRRTRPRRCRPSCRRAGCPTRGAACAPAPAGGR